MSGYSYNLDRKIVVIDIEFVWIYFLDRLESNYGMFNF